MPSSLLSRSPGRFSLLVAFIAPALAYAQPFAPDPGLESVPLDQMVISASRSPQDPHNVPEAVSVLNPNDLALEQVGDLRTALAQTPGVNVVNTGAVGAVSSVSIRGGSSYQTLFIVDGVRMNDRSADYGNFLGSADLSNIGHLEVLRGPQSTLYGSSAMGGVIVIDSVRGQGAPSGSVDLTAGSFNSWGASAAVSGGESGLSYSAALGHFSTANDRDYNDLRQWSDAIRLAYQLTPNLEVGATFREQIAHYEEPGSLFFVAPGAVDAQNTLATIFAQARLGEDFTSRLTLGLHDRLYDFDYGSGVSDLQNTRRILDWQNTWEASSQVEVVAGANYENSHYTVDGVKTTDELGAGYVSVTARPGANLDLTAGGRYDDYKSAGSAATWRLGVSWQPAKGTKLRATYGTGFSAPGSDDRYGVAEFGELPNPNIQPEKSRGWDVGIDQDVLDGRGTVSVTYFRNRFRNLFDFEYVDPETFQGRIENLASATTNGVEFGANAHLGSRVQIQGAYTYLNANDDVTGGRLSRRPRHLADADVTFEATRQWTVGAGLHFVADNYDPSGQLGGYSTVRAFTSYAVTKQWVVKVRVENLLNRKYEEAAGYPALPFGAFGSVEMRF